MGFYAWRASDSMFLKTLTNVALMLSILCAVGCTTSNGNGDPIAEEEQELEKKRPGAILTINKIISERQDKEEEVMVPSFWNNEKMICVDRNSLLTPQGIKSIERLPNDKVANSYDLILTLSNSGLMKYDIIFTTYGNVYLALLIDGAFYKTIKMTALIDTIDSKIFIPGPFSDELSKKIVAKSEVNYNYYNGIRPRTFFEKMLDPK